VNYLEVANLDHDELVLAWALVRTVEPALELGAWRKRGEALIDGRGGVIAAQCPNGIIHGLATYEVVERRAFGSVLEVATLVTFDLTRHGYARHALLDQLHRIRRALGCAAAVINEIKRPTSPRIGPKRGSGQTRK
jgi:hypothetical protein